MNLRFSRPLPLPRIFRLILPLNWQRRRDLNPNLELQRLPCSPLHYISIIKAGVCSLTVIVRLAESCNCLFGGSGWTRTNDVSLWRIYSPLLSPLSTHYLCLERIGVIETHTSTVGSRETHLELIRNTKLSFGGRCWI